MSYYVRSLIADRAKIYSNVIQKDHLTDRLELDLENDEYNDLLLVEKKVRELYEEGTLSPTELDTLDEFSLGKTTSIIAKEKNMDRIVVKNTFFTACEKIAYCLGGTFTDSGYTDYMIEKYKLDSDQTKKLIVAMRRGI